jgi:hypothetical protein
MDCCAPIVTGLAASAASPSNHPARVLIVLPSFSLFDVPWPVWCGAGPDHDAVAGVSPGKPQIMPIHNVITP